MLKSNRNIAIISLIALVNMLGYGIIIPLMYAYSKKFGLSDFDNGLLFSLFSICQFISTPIIGRLSDKYGRRPMLIISILGTALSFFITAFAPNAFVLFFARALDGITAGNIPVAFAVVSDVTKPEERPKAFGVVGSALNFGFVFGPATAAFTVGFGLSVPFLIAGIVTLIAALLTFFYLPETNSHLGEVRKGKLFDFPKMWQTLFDRNLGPTFLISLTFSFAIACGIMYGFQPYTISVLRVTPFETAALFTLFGIVGLFSQNVVVDRVAKKFGVKKAFTYSLIGVALGFVGMFFSYTLAAFVVAMLFMAVPNSIVQTLIPTILSQETDARSQGTVMGLNSSYQSIGMIFGPIVGGVIATIAIPWTFMAGAFFVMMCYLFSFRILQSGVAKESAF